MCKPARGTVEVPKVAPTLSRGQVVETQGGTSAMPKELQRHLVVAPIPAQTLTPVLAGESPGHFPLAGPFSEYGEWDLVSHTFEVRDDGSAILTAVFETRVRSRRRHEEGNSEAQREAPNIAPREERREQRKQERMRRKQERVRQKQERRA
jgi:hypothetical protein